jgi:beta-glucosidase
LTVDVANTGQRAGAEVAQIYLGLPSNIDAPPRQLKRFARILLQPGERRTLTFVLGRQDLSYWDPGKRDWVMASGDYSVWVGGSSRDLRAAMKFHVAESR